MRLILGSGLILISAQAAAIAQQGYSETYTRCINHAYGQTEVLQKCIDQELKQHKKRLKKSYRAYYKVSGQHQANVIQQYELWERRVQSQCYTAMDNQFGRLQQSRCVLAQVIEQANYYGTRYIP